MAIKKISQNIHTVNGHYELLFWRRIEQVGKQLDNVRACDMCERISHETLSDYILAMMIKMDIKVMWETKVNPLEIPHVYY